LKPTPLYTTFPHPKYPTLDRLMDKLNSVHQEDENKAPQIVFVMNGTFHIPVSYVPIGYPIMIIGAGQEKTFIQGGGFFIQGKKEEGKNVALKDMTISEMREYGVFGYCGLSWLCDSMTITQCEGEGVFAENTKGRLINCVITQCGSSGIFCRDALIELEGSQTKVDGNGTSGSSYNYGLTTYYTSSIIHLLFPLTKEFVFTNNHNGQNYVGHGTIETVAAFNTNSSTAN